MMSYTISCSRCSRQEFSSSSGFLWIEVGKASRHSARIDGKQVQRPTSDMTSVAAKAVILRFLSYGSRARRSFSQII